MEANCLVCGELCGDIAVPGGFLPASSMSLEPQDACGVAGQGALALTSVGG